MSDFFKSAMGYFNNPNVGSSAGNGGNGVTTQSGSTASLYSGMDNEFCGQIVEITGHKLRVKHVIAEGGYAFVYVAQDLQTGKEYALKRLIGADKTACAAIINEINMHKQLSGHPNIVTFVGASFVDKTTGPQQRAEYLLLTELCKGGSLIDCLSAPLEPTLVLKVFYQAARALAHVHAQTPPITHRDIKIENFLIGNDQQLKLCDFGSATKESYAPNLDWSAHQRNMLEDQLSSVTTPMYRAPEILDTWSNYEIGIKMDIWALGCILYVLCFQKHPFEDSAKLRIVNGNYIIPVDSRYNCFHEIIKGCLIVNPAQRFNISMILERLAALAETRNWTLKGALELHGKSVQSSPVTETQTTNGSYQQQPQGASSTATAGSTITTTVGNSAFYDDPTASAASAAPTLRHANTQQPAAAAAAANSNNSLFSTLRGGAGSFLKNLKDTSSKVMQTMQQSIARNDLDISYITSRVLVMPCPSEGFETAYKTNNIEDVRLSIESRFAPQKVSIYNFGARNCPRLPPPVRTVEAGSIYACLQARAPNLQGMFSVAEDMYGFLTADPKSIVIIQTGDSGGCTAATMVCALLMYADLIQEPEDAVQVFAVKRHPINLRPSEFRYLYYFGDLLRPTPLLPHYKSINLVSLSCQPVPRMTKARDGCRMYIEVFNNERLLLSTVQNYEQMRLYSADVGKIVLPVNLSVCGDLTVVLYHARNALKGMVRPQGLKICQFQLHTGFIPEQETLINFSTNDLDDLPTDAEQVPTDFTVALSLTVTDAECTPSRNPPWFPPKPQRNSHHLFSSQLEYEEMLDNFVTKPTMRQQHNTRAATQTGMPTATSMPTETSMPTATSVQQKQKRASSPLILPDVTEIGHDEAPAPMPEPSPPIDLLNLNQATMAAPQKHSEATIMPTSDASFDLLGAFGDDSSSGIGSTPIPDILVADGTQAQTSAGLDDIFGSLGAAATSNFTMDFNAFGTSNNSTKQAPTASFQPNVSTTATPFINVPCYSATSKETSPQQQSKDPFADIANLASGLNINFNPNTLGGSKSAGTTPLANSPQATQFSSPTHNNSNGLRSGMSQQHAQSAPTKTGTSTQQHKSPNGSAFAQTTQAATAQAQSTATPTTSAQRPDYSRMHFDAQKGQATAAGGAPKNADIFGDILGAQGYSFGSKTNQGPRSINEMRKEDIIKDMDPNKVKIMEWTEGKKGNIRALLCSMHSLLWQDAKWRKCEMSTLMTPTDVKKAYRRACLAVHPDKHNGTDNEEIAKLIFIELNNAWTDFENDATQQSMFST